MSDNKNNPENHKINIHDGIHTLKGYVTYPHTPTSIDDYENIIKAVGINLRTEKIVGVGRFTYGTKCEPVNDKRKVAAKLNVEFGLGAKQARYEADGTFYNLIENFPAVLFDLYGYVIFANESDVIGVSDKPKERKPSKTRDKGVQLAPGEKPIPYRNNYVSGVCPTCKEDFSDLESHYVRCPTHRKK